jgi:hypothetical protein
LHVSSDCGIRVPALHSDQVIADLAAAMKLLASDDALRQRMSAAARVRATNDFSWEGKIELFDADYAAFCKDARGPIATSGIERRASSPPKRARQLRARPWVQSRRNYG